MSETERQKQLRQDFLSKVLRVTDTEAFGKLPPDDFDRGLNFICVTLAEEIAVLKQEHPAFLYDFLHSAFDWKTTHPGPHSNNNQ